MHWRRKWQPTPVFLPGESQGWGAWWAAVYGVAQSRTWLKRLSSSNSSSNVRAKCFNGGDAFSGELNWVFIPMMSFAAEGVSKFLEIRAAQKWSKGGHRTGTGAAKVATRGPLGDHNHSSHCLPYSHWRARQRQASGTWSQPWIPSPSFSWLALGPARVPSMAEDTSPRGSTMPPSLPPTHAQQLGGMEVTPLL